MVASDPFDHQCPSDVELASFVQATPQERENNWIIKHLETCGDCFKMALVVKRLKGEESSQDNRPHPVSHMPPSPAGEVYLQGRYQLGEELGRGTYANVRRAIDRKLDRSIAVKLLRHSPRFSHATSQLRFEREARTLAKLTHPNIIAIYDTGVVDVEREAYGEMYIAMELAEGANVREWLRQSERSQLEILRVFLHAAQGLAAAHSLDIIHRDFKPENVLLTGDGVAKVADFGLSSQGQFDGDSSENVTELKDEQVENNLTMTGTSMGTPAYMAPEVVNGLPATAVADVFSFSVALFEALTHTHPYANSVSTLREVYRAANQDRSIRLARTSLFRCSERLRRGLEHGLCLDPTLRLSSMEEWVATLQSEIKYQERPQLSLRSWMGRNVAVAAAFTTIVVVVSAVGLGSASKHASDGPTQQFHDWCLANKTAVPPALPSIPLLPDWTKRIPLWHQTYSALNVAQKNWQGAAQTLCEQPPNDISSEQLNVAIGCLDSQQKMLRAKISLLSSGTSQAQQMVFDELSRSKNSLMDMALSLPYVPFAPSECLTYDTDWQPWPRDSRTTEAVTQARTLLTHVELALARLDLRHADQLLQEVQIVVESTAYPPLSAELAFAVARRKEISEGFSTVHAAWLEALRQADSVDNISLQMFAKAKMTLWAVKVQTPDYETLAEQWRAEVIAMSLHLKRNPMLTGLNALIEAQIAMHAADESRSRAWSLRADEFLQQGNSEWWFAGRLIWAGTLSNLDEISRLRRTTDEIQASLIAKEPLLETLREPNTAARPTAGAKAMLTAIFLQARSLDKSQQPTEAGDLLRDGSQKWAELSGKDYEWARWMTYLGRVDSRIPGHEKTATDNFYSAIDVVQAIGGSKDPWLVELYERLGDHWVQTRTDVPGGLRMMQKAVDLAQFAYGERSRPSYFYRFNFAVALNKAGHHKDALDLLNQLASESQLAKESPIALAKFLFNRGIARRRYGQMGTECLTSASQQTMFSLVVHECDFLLADRMLQAVSTLHPLRQQIAKQVAP